MVHRNTIQNKSYQWKTDDIIIYIYLSRVGELEGHRMVVSQTYLYALFTLDTYLDLQPFKNYDFISTQKRNCVHERHQALTTVSAYT